jgi:hypothetical protein
VSTSLSQGLPEALKSIQTRPLFVLREQVPALLIIGQTPNAFRRIGVIQGGSFKGERLSGEVVSGNDWQAVRTDSCLKLDVRLVLRTTDGGLIVMTSLRSVWATGSRTGRSITSSRCSDWPARRLIPLGDICGFRFEVETPYRYR